MPPKPDERFARLKTDPRFRRPKQKQLKVEIDERFRDVLESEEFGGSGKSQGKGKGGKGKGKAGEARVDKRGRPLAASHQQDQLKRFYRLRSPSAGAEGEDDADADGAGAGPSDGGFIDYARGEGALESSGSEDESGDSDAESEVSEQELEIGGKRARRLPEVALSDSEGGSDSDAESHLDIDLSETDEPPSAFPPELDDVQEEDEEEEEDDAPTTDPTNRIAVVNLDWDNLQAADLYAVFSSFLRTDGRKIKGKEGPPAGRVVDVKIYPSEFGKERMAKEEELGPGGGIFARREKKAAAGGKKAKAKGRREEVLSDSELEEESEGDDEGEESDLEGDESDLQSEGDEDEEGDDDEDEEDEDEDQEGIPDDLEIISDVSSRAGSEDIDMDQLRQYQLERLRYYYAIATFSTIPAAEYVMGELNGTEFERTANVFDLTFVPEGMEFDEDDVKDTAIREPKAYKGTDFVTDALRHSKVRLTWDQDDPNRSKLTRKALTRDEIEEQDFKNLIAGSDSESGSDLAEGSDSEAGSDAEASGARDAKAKRAKARARKDKLRALLLPADGDDEEAGEIWGKAGRYADIDSDGRAGATGAGAESKHGGMEITFKSALASDLASAAGEDNMTSLEKYQMRLKEKKARKKEKAELRRAEKGEDAEDPKTMDKGKGADDGFFGEDDGEESDVPGLNGNGGGASDDDDEAAEEAAEMTGKGHFSMKDILKAEKAEGKGSRRKRAAQRKREAKNAELGRVREVELGQEGWKVDVKDPRFAALHEEAEFAIDPSNPAFTKTKAMQDLLTERARVRAAKEKSGKGGSGGGSGSANAPAEAALAPRKTVKEDSGPDLAQLVKSVKRKAGHSGGVASVPADKADGRGDAGQGGEEGGKKKRKRSRSKKKGVAGDD